MPMALVVAASSYFNELWEAIDHSETHAVVVDFEGAVALALEHQPDLILVVPPPIRDALKSCERLLGNRATRNIPISLVSLGHNMIDDASSISLKSRAQATANEFLHRKFVRDKGKLVADNDQHVVHPRRQKQLLGILDLLRYAEAEISKLELETSVVLLGATIADVAQNLK